MEASHPHLPHRFPITPRQHHSSIPFEIVMEVILAALHRVKLPPTLCNRVNDFGNAKDSHEP